MRIPFFRTSLLLLTGLAAAANDTAIVNIRFVSPLTIDKFNILLHDGIQEHKLTVLQQSRWQGNLFSPYGHIDVYYKNTDTTTQSQKIFFKKGTTEISLVADDQNHFTVDDKHSTNIELYDDLGGEEMKAHTKESLDTVMSFIYKNRQYFSRDTTLLNHHFSLFDAYRERQLDFIRKNPQLYVSSWTFLTEFLIGKTNPDTLQAVFSRLPASFRNSGSGAYISREISARKAMAAEKIFPQFELMDMHKKWITPASLGGKYVLIQFWASWCVPCIREIPKLKAIHQKFDRPDFKIISISIDSDSLAWTNAVKKHAMPWTQIIDRQLIKTLSYGGVPQLYLLDPDGRIIYDDVNVDTNDPDLTRLETILAGRLKK